MQPNPAEPILSPIIAFPVEAATARRGATARPSAAAASRTPRHDRSVERRSALSSLVAELSAAAATIDDDVTPSSVPALSIVSRQPAIPARDSRQPANPTHNSQQPAIRAHREPPVLDAEDLRALARMEEARAESEVLNARIAAEHAARAEAERRLAEAQDELRFLRAEMQMVGVAPRREPGPLRRALRAFTRHRRPMVPTNNPRKERLGA